MYMNLFRITHPALKKYFSHFRQAFALGNFSDWGLRMADWHAAPAPADLTTEEKALLDLMEALRTWQTADVSNPMPTATRQKLESCELLLNFNPTDIVIDLDEGTPETLYSEAPLFSSAKHLAYFLSAFPQACVTGTGARATPTFLFEAYLTHTKWSFAVKIAVLPPHAAMVM